MLVYSDSAEMVVHPWLPPARSCGVFEDPVVFQCATDNAEKLARHDDDRLSGPASSSGAFCKGQVFLVAARSLAPTEDCSPDFSARFAASPGGLGCGSNCRLSLFFLFHPHLRQHSLGQVQRQVPRVVRAGLLHRMADDSNLVRIDDHNSSYIGCHRLVQKPRVAGDFTATSSGRRSFFKDCGNCSSLHAVR